MRKRVWGGDPVETIARYIESESQCLMAIVVEETKHDYGVRLLKTMANELREVFGGSVQKIDGCGYPTCEECYGLEEPNV